MSTKPSSIDVLHVDDDPEFADLVATFLERESDAIEVITANSPSEGLSVLADRPIDCVVSDYDMTRMDGLQFLERVREEHGQLPFVLFTGKGSEEIASEAIRAGVTDYLQKGGGSDRYAMLANRIHNAVESYRSRRELEASRERLALFFDQSPLGVIEWDKNFDIVRMNPAAEKILGYETEELEGRSWEVIVPESEMESVGEVIDQVMEARGGFHSVNENCRKDGETIVCEWHNRVVTDEDDEVVAVFSQFQDVTDRVDERRRLEALIDNVPGIVYRHREETGWPLEFVRGACEELTGYTTEELQSEVRFAEEVIHPEDREHVRTHARTEPGVKESFDLVYRLVRNDGTERWVWERGGHVDVPGADEPIVEGFLIDITELKRDQIELEETNTVLSTLLQTLPIGVLVEDADREIRAVNATFCDLFDLSSDPDDLLGRDCGAVLEQCSDRFAEPPQQVERIETLLDRREAVREESIDFADGRTIARTYIPYELPDGDANLWLYRDVTDRRRRERELERERKHLESLHEATTRLYRAETIEVCYGITIEAAVTTLGFDWCTIAEPAPDGEFFEIVAISEDAPLSVGDRPFRVDEGLAGEVYQTKTASIVDDVIDDDQAEPTDDTIRSGLTVPVGDRGIFQAAATEPAAFDERDRRHAELLTASMLPAVERIEKQRELRTSRDELEVQNSRLEEVASIVSHDLQSPLSVIDGRLSLAREECDSEHLDAIESAHGRMKALVEDLLELTRVSDLDEELEPVDLASIVEDCWQHVETADAEIWIEIDREIRADRRRLKQLLENLVGNAVTHGGETVTVVVGELDDGFYVADDGQGIPPAERDRVFESGYSSSPDGTGLGLNIVQQIANAHGWTIEVAESAHGGARFEITGVEFA